MGLENRATLRQGYAWVRRRLEEAGCDSPAFDASCLLEEACGVVRGELPVKGDRLLTEREAAQLTAAAEERAAGRPLQYILGQWDFLGLTLSVGEGVLIPRPDTERLCEWAAGQLSGYRSPRILDLCAGSGCVGLGVASLCPGIWGEAVEWSPEAETYLRRNLSRYPQWPLEPVRADVLAGPPQEWGGRRYEAILSNPPYIPTEELPGLMREVQREPSLALDGGEDGLRFYRAILTRWLPLLASGGFCAVEVGAGQAQAVAQQMENAGLERVVLLRDYGGIQRVVAGFRPKEETEGAR